MGFYSDAAEAAALCGKAETDIREAWQGWVDDLIEQYAGQGYKGAVRTVTRAGDDGELLVLPSTAQSLTLITEEGVTLSPSQYRFSGPSRLVKRLPSPTTVYDPFRIKGYWPWGAEYVITYEEPTTVPGSWQAVANQCVAQIAMFVDKHTDYGVAVSTSNNGQAGGGGGGMVQSSQAQSFPASLLSELRITIQNGIKRVGF